MASDTNTVVLERDLLHFQTISRADQPIGSLTCTSDYSRWSIWWYDTGDRLSFESFKAALHAIHEATGCKIIRSTVGIRH